MTRARVSIELDPHVLSEVIAELELSDPPTFTLNHSGKFASHEPGKTRGTYHAGNNHVTVTTQGQSYGKEGLYVLTKHIRMTVLHELRHAWQREHWTKEQRIAAKLGPYALRLEEIDAESWAEYASPKFRKLVVVTRQQIGRSGLSRLSEAESKTRRQP